MELRYKEVERARGIFERYVRCLPTVKAWVRFAKFEMRNGEVGRARGCYERAVEEMGDDANTVRPLSVLVELALDRQARTCTGLHRLCASQEELFIKFAEFEEKVKEVDRARAIYRYALDHIPREQVRSCTGLLCPALPRVDDTQNHVFLSGA